MNLFKFILLSTLFIVLGFPVSAQDSSEAASITEGQEQVTFEQLRSDYLYQLDLYRKAEDTFNLDKAEFNKLGTLVSREQAVTSMKPYLLQRARVMTTYLIALEFLLQDMQGVDVNARRQTLERSLSVRNWMRDYILSIDSIVDREGANQAAVEFENNVWRVFEAQNRMLSLIALGPVQVVFDRLELVTEEFETVYVENIPEEGKQSVIRRGLQDVIRENDAADEKITTARNTFYPFISVEEYLNAKGRNKPDYQTMYNSMVSNLQDSFSSMKQSVRYLQELERQL